MKNKILIFADHFLPGFRAGGPILSLSLLYENLQEHFDPIVATRNRDFGEAEPYREVSWDETTLYLEYTVHYFSKVGWAPLLALVRACRPKSIYLNSFFSAFSRRILILNRFGLVPCPVILAPRGELSTGALAIKGFKKRTYLSLFKALNLDMGVVFHATDKSEESDIKRLFRAKTCLIPNFSRPVAVGDFPLPQKRAGSLNLVFLSRISEKKNLLGAMQILAEGAIRGEVAFDVYGPIEDAAYWDRCLAKSRELSPNIRFRYLGAVESKDVLGILSRYHVLLLPTRNENFGHVIVEAMKLGLLPIVSDQTPWRGLEEIDAGWDLPLGGTAKFAEAIRRVVEMGQSEFSTWSAQAQSYIGQATGSSRYKEEYHSLFDGLAGDGFHKRSLMAVRFKDGTT